MIDDRFLHRRREEEKKRRRERAKRESELAFSRQISYLYNHTSKMYKTG